VEQPPVALTPEPAPEPAPMFAPPMAVPAVSPVTSSVIAPAISAVASPAPTTPVPVAAAALIQPKLLTMVEPDIPARVLVDGPRVSEIFADLTLRPDGTVASVALLPGAPRAWQRFVVSALERWRFEPLPATRVHRVQLVFSE